MTQPGALPTLMSPQQLLQLRQSPMPAAPPVPQPIQAPAKSFNSVSSLLSPDQLQRFTPHPNPGTPGPLSSPLSLFGAQTVRPAAPALGMSDLRHQQSVESLKQLDPKTLKVLGQSNKKAFFAALLPGAIESEKKYGVPAEVTLAQAALESGWAESPIGKFNIFGIKGSGPAGSTQVNTSEFLKGRWVKIKDKFALYNNFYEAISKHGALFHNGYYDKAVDQYAKDRNVNRFVDNIHGIYATDPNYSSKIKGIINDFGLKQMVDQTQLV